MNEPLENFARLGASRRAMLAGIAALGVSIALPTPPASEAATTQKRRRIDVHHHFVPIEAIGSRHIVEPLRSWSVERSLGDMDKGGVTTAMLSFTPQVLTALAQ